MRIVFEVAGDRQIDREILRWGERAGDATPAFQAIGELLIGETKVQFDTEGRHASGGWKPLKRATVASKQRRGLRLSVLQSTGSLMDSLTKRGDSNMILETSPTELTFGSRVPYGGFHQTGTRRMPARKPLELTEATRRTSVKILQRWIVEGQT